MSKYAKIIYGSGRITITRRVRIPDEIVGQIPNEWTDNLVHYAGGSGDKYERTFRNDFGSFYQGFGPSKEYPLGRNAIFIPKNGTPIGEAYWGFVQEDKDPRVGKYVPGWCDTTRLIGHPDRCGTFNIWTRKRYQHWYDDLPVGTDIRSILKQQGFLKDL